MTREEIYALAESTNDAYSWDAYGEAQWRSLIRRLDKAGYDARQIEAIVRSKHTRWSRDVSGGYRGKASDFMSYMSMSTANGLDWKREVEQLVAGTFGG